MLEAKIITYKQVLTEFNCSISRGNITTFVGPSGCGKSSLLRILAGLEKEYTGTVYIDGQKLTSFSPKERACKIGFVFQEASLFPHQKVLEACMQPLILTLGLSKKEAKERVYNLLSRFQMEELINRYPHTLSGGQKQRIAIIRSLGLNPDCLLLDEPSSALDHANALLLANLLLELKTEGKAIGIVSHDQTFLALLNANNHFNMYTV